jgi:hypothetical protein
LRNWGKIRTASRIQVNITNIEETGELDIYILPVIAKWNAKKIATIQLRVMQIRINEHNSFLPRVILWNTSFVVIWKWVSFSHSFLLS